MSRLSKYRTVAVLLILVAVLMLVLFEVARPTLLERARLVRDGMTQGEVERAMGRPPDRPAGAGNPAVWVSGNDTFEVEYNDGCVSKLNFYSTYVIEASAWDRFLDWLGL